MKALNENARDGEAVFQPLPPDAVQLLCIGDDGESFSKLRPCIEGLALDGKPGVAWAYTLDEALALLTEDKCFDIILYNLGSSESCGPKMLAQLSEASPAIPVIFLCEDRERALALEPVKRGSHDYLPLGSLNADMLAQAIRHALERQRSRIEMAAMDALLQQSSSDLRSVQMMLIQAEKLDSLGKLAAGVAHEVKNPLATLQMGVDYFHMHGGRKSKADSLMIGHMQEAITSASRIIRGMVDYSRSDALQLKIGNINSSVRKAMGMVRHEVLRHNVKVVQSCCDPLPAVKVDEGKIEQVLINILANAMQAMGHSGADDRTLTVTTSWGRLAEIDPDQKLRDCPHFSRSDHVVVVEVRDRGPGIPEEKISKVFEPFFTTKPTGQGTGLGLSVAKNIIDLHHGHFQVENEEDPHGLKVRIILKACENADVREEHPNSRPVESLCQQTPSTQHQYS